MKFEEIWKAWEILENAGKDTVIEELNRLKHNCSYCMKLFNSYGSDYEKYYFVYSEAIKPVSIIQEFFYEIEKISKEDFSFFTEGYTAYKLEDFLSLSNIKKEKRYEWLCGYMDYVNFLEHAFVKILNENFEEKKKSMLKGLFGI